MSMACQKFKNATCAVVIKGQRHPGLLRNLNYLQSFGNPFKMLKSALLLWYFFFQNTKWMSLFISLWSQNRFTSKWNNHLTLNKLLSKPCWVFLQQHMLIGFHQTILKILITWIFTCCFSLPGWLMKYYCGFYSTCQGWPQRKETVAH